MEAILALLQKLSFSFFLSALSAIQPSSSKENEWHYCIGCLQTLRLVISTSQVALFFKYFGYVLWTKLHTEKSLNRWIQAYWCVNRPGSPLPRYEKFMVWLFVWLLVHLQLLCCPKVDREVVPIAPVHHFFVSVLARVRTPSCLWSLQNKERTFFSGTWSYYCT